MLAILGYLMVITFLYLIISKRLSPFTSLIIIPVLFGILAGSGSKLGSWMMEGIENVAPTAFLLLFAIMYFGIMLDTGLFEPLTGKILSLTKGDPLKIIVGTAILSGIIGFDGDGSTTMMICVTAFLPLYKRLGIRPVILASIIIMQVGITTLVPWGGPSGRVASVLHLDPTDLYKAMLPGMIIGLLYVVGVAYILGKKERARFNIEEATHVMMASAVENPIIESPSLKDDQTIATAIRRPNLIWVNFLLSAVIMVGIILEWLPSAVLFIIGTSLALLINYPSLRDQRERIAAHAPNALAVVSMIIAAGIFAGIFKGSGMSGAMAQTLISIIPLGLGSHMSIITAIVSVPALFFLGPDGFYFGILPLLAETGASYGVSAKEIGVASLFGTPFGIMGPLVASIYLLIEITNINLGDLHKHTMKWALGIVVIYIIVALVVGVISF
ncbi:CitMHS family transporter [Priestia megaterium]|uniref:CitMHS family transporter n=1 Tax=Priestia megaterium TaxID=1404 RepID=UPI001C2268B3|nr:citrate:proton symporter [Priestia megaterium]MBU8690822.1 citrate:proton symporter [Priestia megaterium]